MSIVTTALPFFGGDDGPSSDHQEEEEEEEGYSSSSSSYECFAAGAMHMMTTANYETKKGACRKCGCIAYFKRKCQRCHRKFCNTCAPNSLQKYGENPHDECCIGCEPFLIVTPAESEPILEMEPESEEIFLLNTIHAIHNSSDNNNDSNNNESSTAEVSSSSTLFNNNSTTRSRRRRKGPIHVPLSATCCSVEEKDDEQCTNDVTSNCKGLQSPPVFHDSSTTTTSTPTTVDSSQSTWREEEEEESCLTASGNFFSSAAGGASPVDFLGLPSWLYSNNHDDDDPATATANTPASPDPTAHQSAVANTTENAIPTTLGRQHHNNKQQQQQEQEVVYKTPESNRKIREISTLYCGGGSTSIPKTPLTPEAGCCTACQVYSTGKSPCPTCGTKYCSESRCQDYLYDDGTCAKCCSRRKLPELPIPTDAGCCTSCQQFAIGKVPCKSCGAKFCQEVACQTYLFDDGTCVVCHGNI